MDTKSSEILDELKTVVSGKTIDAIFPPLIFVLANNIFNLDTAVYSALGLAFIIGLSRILRRQNWYYALGGLLGVALASGLAFLTQSAVGYFLPTLVSSASMVLITLISLVIGKPLAAWASHLTRGWPLDWFWRSDIKPAYREVTWFWAFFFILRLSIQLVIFQSGDAATLAWANTLLGWPVFIVVLVITYIYGVWRLNRLGGPGVEEFRSGKKPPWQGQTRGF
ncbi:MAG: DUF3159 domain-containing protein [Bacillota bacterium]